MILQVRDPYWIHAYWELREATLAQGRKKLAAEGPQARLTLRVYRVKPPRSFDILLTGGASDWAVQVEPAGSTWWVEVGLKSPSGRFELLIRSKRVTTPPDRPSEEIDQAWGFLEGTFPSGRGSSS